MITLGLNPSPHDSAAALVINGVAVAAAEEERFTRVRHARSPQDRASWQMPSSAIAWCLEHAGITLEQVDHVCTPALVAHGAPMRPDELTGGGTETHWRWHVLERHLCHQASAFLAAPFERCAVMTLDGRGDQATIGCGVWRHGRYQRLPDLQVPHPFGLLYERVAAHLGLQRSSDEHTLMALAETGSPAWAYALAADDAWPPALDALAGKPRKPGEPLEPRHADLAASMKRVLHAQVLALAECLRDASGERHLALAGGESLQCIAGSRLHEQGLFDSVWVQPARGDAGTALGAALWMDARLRVADVGDLNTAPMEAAECELAPRRWVMSHAHLGPAWPDDEVAPLLRWAGVSFEVLPDETALAERGAQLLNEGCVLGWFQGRMEWGPHALGSRSLLASPLQGDAQAKLGKVAGRALPLSPTAVAAETFADWFAGDDAQGRASPHAPFRHRARPEVAHRIAFACDANGVARVQTIDAETNPRLGSLLDAFSRLSGVPMLANAPFSVGSQPIVCSPQDALDAFFESSLDALVIGNCVVLRAVT